MVTMVTVKYREYAPCAGLTSHVACYWALEVPPDAPKRSGPVLPDGCIDLLFESSSGQLDVVGTMTRALWTDTTQPSRFVGVRFKPGGAVPFFRDRADSWTDHLVDAQSVFGARARDLKESLLSQASTLERVREIEAFLVSMLDRGAGSVDPRIAWGATLLRHQPDTRVGELARGLGVSRQYARRLFLEHAGVSPKAFARVARLGKLAGELQDGAALADSALAAGYSDQAHMTREFKALVGVTPTAYRQRP